MKIFEILLLFFFYYGQTWAEIFFIGYEGSLLKLFQVNEFTGNSIGGSIQIFKALMQN